MGLLPSAVGYLRSDVSGLDQPQDELRIMSAASRTGYDLRKTLVFNEHTEDRERRLRVAVNRLGVDAVIVPSPAHFEDRTVPAELLEIAAVVMVSGDVHPRRNTGAPTSPTP